METVIRAKNNVTKGITEVSGIPKTVRERAEILHVLKKYSLFDILWYSVFFVFGMVCIAIFYDDWTIYLTVGELFIYLFYANLIARGKVLGIWLNFVDCLMYGAISFITGAYGELFKTMVISNIFNIYGVISWTKQGNNNNDKKIKDKAKEQDDKNINIEKNKPINGSVKLAPKQSNELQVRALSVKMLVILVVLYIVSTVGVYFVLDLVNTTYAYLGAITFTASMFNKYLSMARYKESWWVSLLGSSVLVVMWTLILVSGVKANGDWTALPVLGTNIASLVNTVNGIIIWNKLYKRTIINGGEYLAMRPVKVNRIIKLKRKYAHLKWTEKTDHIPTPEEVALNRRISVSVKRGLFS